jgi:hypothetical protein
MALLLAPYSRHSFFIFFEFLSTGKTLGPPAVSEEASTRWGKPPLPWALEGSSVTTESAEPATRRGGAVVSDVV